MYNKDKHSPHGLWCCWTLRDPEWFFPDSEPPDGLNAAHTPSRSASPAVSTDGDSHHRHQIWIYQTYPNVMRHSYVPYHVVGLALVDLGLQGLDLELGLPQLADTLTSRTLILV